MENSKLKERYKLRRKHRAPVKYSNFSRLGASAFPPAAPRAVLSYQIMPIAASAAVLGDTP